MKTAGIILGILLFTIIIAPAYAVIVQFQTDKISYKKGDKIVFSGKTDEAHSNNMVAVKIYGPNGGFVMIKETFSDADGNFEMPAIDTSQDKVASKFNAKGIYNATAFYSKEPTYKGRFTLFDYSPDGSPVIPSAAQVMAQSGQTSQQSQSPPAQQPTQIPQAPNQTQTPTQTPQSPPSQTPQSQQPSQPMEVQCGAGTILQNGVCVVSQPQYEPEPEEPSRYKKTHIPGFPDPSKEPQYYINRYNSETEYKAWFDRNFPDTTIYEILGVPKPQEPTGCGPGTRLEGDTCVLDQKKQTFGGGCLVATATYGTELSPQVQQLRELRDTTLARSNFGVAFLTSFNDIYYVFSPTIADWERQNPIFKETVKVVITPILLTFSILNYVEINSESDVVLYGVGVILLNFGIYFVLPTLVLIKIRKHHKLHL